MARVKVRNYFSTKNHRCQRKILFAFGVTPPYNAFEMSDNKLIEYFAWAIFGILVIWGIVTAIDAIAKFFSNHMWLLWLLISLVVVGVIAFFTRHYITLGIKRVLAVFKKNASNNTKPEHNNTTHYANKKRN